MSEAGARRSGRRPGTSSARDDILGAARRAFAELGYDRATIRSVAREADVDPALIHHYFGSKRDLFAAVMDVQVNPANLVDMLLEGDPGDLGERMARLMLTVWDDEDFRAQLVGLLRTAVADDQAAAMIREFATTEVIGRIVNAARSDQSLLRTNLLASQVFGLLMTRYVIKLEPLASVEKETLVRASAPTFQRYLTGPL